MASYPILEFTDGTEAGTVSLLGPFFKVESRRMTIVQTKNGGTWQSSPLADGRKLVNRVRGNAIETIELSASAATQDSWAHQLQELERLLEKAVEYWTSASQNTPVYWVDKADCETNKRHALIYDYSIPSLDQILRAPFASKRPGMVNFSVSIERGHWLANPPGGETCVEISGTGPEGIETTDIFSLSVDSDDGNYDSTGGLIQLGANVIAMGDAAGLDLDGIFRFLNITIPPGSVVKSAFVRFEASANDAGAPGLFIKGQDSDNAATFSTATNYLARPQTAASVVWIPGAWVAGNFYDTSDIFSIVQEIIDRDGWLSGNNMGILIEERNSAVNIHREAFSIIDPVGTEAKLHITYSAPTGRAATCDAEVFIANKHNYKNLTHVFYDDAGVGFSANLLGSGLPYDLLPAAVAVGDVVYFGIEDGPLGTITGGGPFFSLVFDLAVGQTGVTFAADWEFWDSTAGPGWNTLSAFRDNTGIQPLDRTGVNSIHWAEEPDWIPNAINGVTAYWIRLRATAIGTPPTQQNRDIYTVNWPYIEINKSQVLGDIIALLRTALDNQARYDSDADISRVIMGLRSNSRGLTFTPYLNCSDQQEIPAINVSVNAPNNAITTEALAPTERAGRWSPPGASAMARRWHWTFQDVGAVPNPTLQWYGSYHVFARVQQTAGTVSDFALQLTIDIGDQTYNSSASPATVQGVDFVEIVDLGRIDIPQGNGILSTAERLRILSIEIHASFAFTGPAGVLDFYDLILMPADEMLIDAQIQTNQLDGGAVQEDEILSIDSVTYPKAFIRSLVRDDSDRVTSLWRTKGAKAFLQSNEDQRLWFLLMTWNTTATDGWAGRFSMAARIQAFNNARYLSLRGER